MQNGADAEDVAHGADAEDAQATQITHPIATLFRYAHSLTRSLARSLTHSRRMLADAMAAWLLSHRLRLRFCHTLGEKLAERRQILWTT